jgi:hypothetical protein
MSAALVLVVVIVIVAAIAFIALVATRAAGASRAPRVMPQEGAPPEYKHRPETVSYYGHPPEHDRTAKSGERKMPPDPRQAPLPRCPACGAAIAFGDVKCPKCGHDLSGA